MVSVSSPRPPGGDPRQEHGLQDVEAGQSEGYPVALAGRLCNRTHPSAQPTDSRTELRLHLDRRHERR